MIIFTITQMFQKTKMRDSPLRRAFICLNVKNMAVADRHYALLGIY